MAKIKQQKIKKAKKQTEDSVVEVKSRPQVFRGRVVSAKHLHTATVLVERRRVHPLYGKSFKRSKKFLVDTENQLVVGDLVEIMQCRPVSKNKNFKVSKVFGRDIEAVITEELKEQAAEEIAEVMPEEKEEVSSENLELSEKEEVVEKIVEKKKKKKTKKGEKST